MNNSYLFLFAGLVFLFILVILSKLVKSKKLPYQKKQYFLTIPERSLYGVLCTALGNRYHIFPQVNLDKIIHVEKGSDNYQSYFHRINQYSVDFVLCEPTNLSPVLAIELDDSSHLLRKRQERDEFVNQVLTDAGLPLLRLPVQQSYNPETLRNQIQAKLTPPS